MKKRINIILLWIFISFLISCSSDDRLTSSNDLLVSLDENPLPGQSIGTIITNLSGDLTFSITSQFPSESFAIDNSTGEVFVVTSSKFDFETNPILGATVTIANSSEKTTALVSVTLNDIDDIAFFLSSSKANYEAASAGEWINITENEYNVLSSQLNEVSKVGSSDTNYNLNTTSNSYGSWTRVNLAQPNISSGSLLFAFKYRTSKRGASISNDTKVKLSTTNAIEGYNDLGSNLPSHKSEGENVHFVLKGYNSFTKAEGFICIYAPGGIEGTNIVSNQQVASRSGDQNDLNDALIGDRVLFYQGLSTTQLQWD